MKTNAFNKLNLLFKLAFKFLKYFLWTLLGFAIAYILAHVSGAAFITQLMLSPAILVWFFRTAVLIFCIFAIAMIIESWT